jgi:hypothetical protein
MFRFRYIEDISSDGDLWGVSDWVNVDTMLDAINQSSGNRPHDMIVIQELVNGSCGGEWELSPQSKNGYRQLKRNVLYFFPFNDEDGMLDED